MTDRIRAALPVALAERLTPEDDPALWEQVLSILAEEASLLEGVHPGTKLCAEVGACSHWLRPHLQFSPVPSGGAMVAGSGKRLQSVPVAVPSRTARHRQGAIHTLWPRKTLDARRTRTVLYGFRNKNGVWELKACSRD